MNAALYARISEIDQSAFSLDAQLEACRAHAAQQGWCVVAEFIEGKSAGSDQRPEFQRMIAAAKAGQFGVILVHKLDRFARNREDAVTYKALLRRVGVQVISVTEQIDEGPMGRLVEGILEVVADWFLANLRQETGKGMRRMAERGLWPSRPPIGYMREPESKRLAPEPLHAEHIAEAFRQFATGRYTLVTWSIEAARLNITERTGKRIHPGRWSVILNNRIYLGEIPFDGRVYPGLHPALVPRETFDRVQAILDAHNGERGRVRASGQQRRQFLLSRLLWSEDTGSPMHGASAKGGKFLYYVSARPVGDWTHRVPCQVLDDQIGPILQNVTLQAADVAGLDLPDTVKFGLQVAASVGSVYSGLDDPAVRRRLVVAVFDRLGVLDRTIQVVKVRSPFCSNGAHPSAVLFESGKYPSRNVNVFAEIRPKNPQKLWEMAS